MAEIFQFEDYVKKEPEKPESKLWHKMPIQIDSDFCGVLLRKQVKKNILPKYKYILANLEDANLLNIMYLEKGVGNEYEWVRLDDLEHGLYTFEQYLSLPPIIG